MPLYHDKYDLLNSSISLVAHEKSGIRISWSKIRCSKNRSNADSPPTVTSEELIRHARPPLRSPKYIGIHEQDLRLGEPDKYEV
jgi:hypothetical protein